MQSAPERGGVSLQVRLPLLISALLLVLLSTGAALAYRQVRDSAVAARVERLERVAAQLAGIIEQSMATRMTLMRSVAGDSTIRRLLAASQETGARQRAPQQAAPAASAAPNELAAAAVLERLEVTTDTLALELRDAEGRAVLRMGDLPSELAAPQIDSLRLLRGVPRAGGYSELVRTGAGTYTWLEMPVLAGDRRIGSIAHLRQVGRAGNSQQVNELIGSNSAAYFVNESGAWHALDGTPASAPDPETSMMRGAPIRGTPLSIAVASPTRDVLAGPTAFLRDLALGSAILMLIGAIAAWLLSRRLVGPLRELVDASGAIAAGDYTRRVDVARRDEIGVLARAFTRMTSEVERAHAALRLQLEEARWLAREVEKKNEQLTDAMAVANHARGEAETASRAKSDFLATMSHEIRTPINAIIGYTELLQIGVNGELTAEQRRQLDRIHASGTHLISLVDEVLDLSRIESGRLEVKERIGRACDAIASAVAVISPEAERKELAIAVCEPPSPIHYRGDPDRVRQILVNLLSNAVKFTPRGGRIEVEAIRLNATKGDEPDGWAGIKVTDTGLGISTEQLETIFEPFVQGERGYTRAHGGVGLGLAISRQLAHMMDGEVDVVSEPGAGSTFTLRLPLARQPMIPQPH